jgi:protein-S-isoprenylcysteine O-methyltransferase Ste14
MPKLLAIGFAGGIAWGGLAAAAFVSMFRGSLPAPGEAGLPLAIALVVLYFPFLVAAAVETFVGRSSPSFGEIIGVTLASGAGLGLLLIAGIALVQRFVQTTRPRS